MRERSTMHGARPIIDRAACLAWLALAPLAGCGGVRQDHNVAGDPHAGAIVIAQQACGSCHEIPGIAEADGTVGPSLAHFARHQTVAGPLANTPFNLRLYLKAPQSVIPGNYMPDEDLNDRQVRDIAAYLYTLR
jgi:cytochrome c1